MEQTELIEYFKTASLPATMQFAGINILDVKKNVEGNINRLQNGVELIKQIAYKDLVKMKEMLENNS